MLHTGRSPAAAVTRRRPTSHGVARISQWLRLAFLACLAFLALLILRTHFSSKSTAFTSSLHTSTISSASSGINSALSYARNIVTNRGLGSTPIPEQSCLPVEIDWEPFRDPGPMFTGTAGIHMTDYSDMSVLWIIHSLQGLGYTVQLLVLEANRTSAEAFLSRATKLAIGKAAQAQITLTTYDERGGFGGSDPPNVFVHLTPDDMPTVAGWGTANILIVLPRPDPLAHDASSPAVEERAVVRDPAALATYDFLIYLSEGTYLRRLPKLIPVLQQLQLSNELFPWIDIMSMPASPAEAPSAELGITISMSRYTRDRRRLLQHALLEFQQLALYVPHVRLIVCTWLMPGIATDHTYLTQQVRAYNIHHLFEYRDDVTALSQYHSIAVQWHLYNPEEKPHYTATASMPAGVWVLDCTGTVSSLKGVLHGECTSLNQLSDNTQRYLKQAEAARSSRGHQVMTKSLDAVTEWYRFKWLYLVHRSFSSKIFRFFIKSTQQPYRSRITPSMQQSRAQIAAQIHQAPIHRRAIVIVETRPHYAFLYCTLNVVWYMPGWELHVVHSRMNGGFVRAMLNQHVTATYHQLDTYNADIDDYNLLMKTPSFWQMFNADHVLLFQTDSIILKYGIDEFVKYDYVGAPWHMENERWSQPQMHAALPDGVGNGGFSMRSTASMVDISTAHGTRSPVKEQEDVFFATNIQQSETYFLADRKTAYRFCLEVPCGDLPAPDPLALHASWFYNSLPAIKRFFETSLLGLGDCSLSAAAAAAEDE